MSRLLSAEPALFINVVASVIGLLVGAGLLSQSNGDAVMQVAGVLIPAILTVIAGRLIRQRVTPA